MKNFFIPYKEPARRLTPGGDVESHQIVMLRLAQVRWPELSLSIEPQQGR